MHRTTLQYILKVKGTMRYVINPCINLVIYFCAVYNDPQIVIQQIHTHSTALSENIYTVYNIDTHMKGLF